MRIARPLVAAIAAALILCLHPFAAQAQDAPPAEENKPAINIRSDAQMEKANQAYEAALTGLTQEQRDYLSYLNKEFAKTMDPDVRILSLAAKLEYCSKTDQDISKDTPRYVQAFTAWRDYRNGEQERLWREHQVLREKADFIDRKILDDYFFAQSKMMLQLAFGMIKAAQKAESYKPEDCAEIKEILETPL